MLGRAACGPLGATTLEKSRCQGPGVCGEQGTVRTPGCWESRDAGRGGGAPGGGLGGVPNLQARREWGRSRQGQGGVPGPTGQKDHGFYSGSEEALPQGFSRVASTESKLTRRSQTSESS